MKWILIVPLIILAVLAGLLILLLLTPTSVRVKYISGVLNCRVKIYGIGLTVYPWKKRKPKKAKKPKKIIKSKKHKKSDNLQKEKVTAAEQKAVVQGREASKETEGKNKETTPNFLKNLDVQKLLEYARFGILSAKRVLRGVKVNHITVGCVIATDDAAKTAVAFGTASAAMSALLPIMDDTFIIKKKNISIDADFSTTISRVDADIKVSTVIYKMVFSALIIFLKFRKMMKKAV